MKSHFALCRALRLSCGGQWRPAAQRRRRPRGSGASAVPQTGSTGAPLRPYRVSSRLQRPRRALLRVVHRRRRAGRSGGWALLSSPGSRLRAARPRMAGRCRAWSEFMSKFFGRTFLTISVESLISSHIAAENACRCMPHAPPMTARIKTIIYRQAQAPATYCADAKQAEDTHFVTPNSGLVAETYENTGHRDRLSKLKHNKHTYVTISSTLGLQACTL